MIQQGGTQEQQKKEFIKKHTMVDSKIERQMDSNRKVRRHCGKQEFGGERLVEGVWQ